MVELSIVTDFYVGASTECILNSRKLKLAFADVYRSEVKPHKTLMVSEYMQFTPNFAAYAPIAAFEVGTVIAETHEYVRDVFENTPITLEDKGFDNFFYVDDNRNTKEPPFQISGGPHTVTVSLLDKFDIRLPFDALPEDHPLYGWGDKTFRLDRFDLQFTKPPWRPPLTPTATLAPPCKWERSSVYFKPGNLIQLYDSGFAILVAECCIRSSVSVLSGNIDTTGFQPKIQMDAFRRMIPPAEIRRLRKEALSPLTPPTRSAFENPFTGT